MRTNVTISWRELIAAAIMFAAVESANAANFDGAWSVNIATTRGSCPSGAVTFQVRNGIVSGTGAYAVSGRVRSNGSVCVRVGGSAQYASGCGRLAGNSGGGTWSGVGSQGACSGRWSASR